MNKSKNLLLFLIITLLTLSSCGSSDEPLPGAVKNDKTLLIYMPWSSNLTEYFYQNIKDMESCIKEMGGLTNERVVVFMSESPSAASLFEIKFEYGSCRRDLIKSYTDPAFTTKAGIREILDDVVNNAPARQYAMIIGCHGMGWLPVAASRSAIADEPYHWEYSAAYPTRYFGGTTAQYQTDISTLSTALSDAGLKMEYILFDDCYMSSIEVAYELKNVADYLIASTCEVMAYGMPYASMGRHLLGKPDYKAVCDDFHAFYSTYAMPCGTLSVTDLSQIDKMAQIMKRINNTYTFDPERRDRIQNLDGYSPTIFFDFGDYVKCMLGSYDDSQNLLAEFENQLDLLIPYKTGTEKFFTASRGPIKLNRYSGITTSDPSVSQKAVSKTGTKWYSATH